MTIAEDLENWFSYHAPKRGQPAIYEEIRLAGAALAARVVYRCPDSPERNEALKKIREAVMWANSAIACEVG